MNRIVELTANGAFVSDFIDGIGLDIPSNWTADLCPDGFMAARYTGARNSSGEWIEGAWIDDGALTVEQESEFSKKLSAQAIAAQRFSRETAGTTVSGVAVFTDRTTQMKLTGAAIRAQRDPSYSVDWKQSDGTYVELSAMQLIAIADAVGDYVQGCYSREAVLLAALADGSYTDAMLVDGWP